MALRCHNLNGSWYFTLLNLVYKFNITNNIYFCYLDHQNRMNGMGERRSKTLRCHNPTESWCFTLLNLSYKFNNTNKIDICQYM